MAPPPEDLQRELERERIERALAPELNALRTIMLTIIDRHHEFIRRQLGELGRLGAELDADFKRMLDEARRGQDLVVKPPLM
jgi:hypothetical protein